MHLLWLEKVEKSLRGVESKKERRWEEKSWRQQEEARGQLGLLLVLRHLKCDCSCVQVTSYLLPSSKIICGAPPSSSPRGLEMLVLQ